VLGSREPVHEQSVSQQIDVLSTHADAVRTAEEERVLEVAVDGLRVVSSRVEVLESRIRRWDGSDVLGPVESTIVVLGVSVQPHGHGATTESLRELVVVVPAEGSRLVLVAVGPDPAQRLEEPLPHIAELQHADGSVPRVERDRMLPRRGPDDLVLDVGLLGDASAFLAPGSLGPSRGGDDPVDREESEIPKELLVVHPSSQERRRSSMTPRSEDCRPSRRERIPNLNSAPEARLRGRRFAERWQVSQSTVLENLRETPRLPPNLHRPCCAWMLPALGGARE
jgi:hypothetical protein